MPVVESSAMDASVGPDAFAALDIALQHSLDLVVRGVLGLIRPCRWGIASAVCIALSSDDFHFIDYNCHLISLLYWDRGRPARWFLVNTETRSLALPAPYPFLNRHPR